MRLSRLVWRPRTFRRQIVLLTAAATAFAMLLLTLVLQLVLAHLSRRDVDRVLDDRVDAVVSSVQATSSDTLQVPDSQLDAGVAVYGASGSLVAGDAPEHLAHTYAELSTTTRLRVQTVDEHDRVEARPFSASSGRGVVVVVERLEPYEEAERLALIVSLVTGILTTAVAATIAAYATSRALRPVAEMARTATDWSEHDLGRRFDLGPPENELSALGATLDLLLERVASAIRSEQRLTSELAHELRTPLTTIQGMAELMLMRDTLPPEATQDLEDVREACHRMSTSITTLLELARNDVQVVAAAHSTLMEVLDETLALGGGTGGVSVDTAVADIRLGLPASLAVRVLAPIVENARRFARSEVRVSTSRGTPGLVEVWVDDDGPGVDSNHAEWIFEPGHGTAGGGAGLGLAIARRIARSAGGDVVLGEGDGVTRFVVRLPVS